MNWDRGLKRITLVMSIIGAILAAGFFFYDAGKVLEHNERLLTRERNRIFNESIQGWSLINEWKRTKSLEEQQRLWKEWTGSGLRGEQLWHKAAIAELKRRGVSLKPEIQKKTEELEKLKEQGWQTIKGELLPSTPKVVWQIRHLREIRDLERTVRSGKIWLPIAPVVGAMLVFGGVWAVYAGVIGIAYPLLSWIILGFHEDKQKDEQNK